MDNEILLRLSKNVRVKLAAAENRLAALEFEILAQQTTNKQSTPCQDDDHQYSTYEVTYCVKCGHTLDTY